VEVARLQLFFDDLFLFRRQVDIHRLRLHWLHYLYDTSVATSVTSSTQSIGTASHQNFWPLRHLIVRRGVTSNPQYENQKSFLLVYLEVRFTEQHAEIQVKNPRKSNTGNCGKKGVRYQPLIFLAERGGLKPQLVSGR
jgi:hypothetical protein